MKKRLITRHPVAELASLLLFGIFVLFLLLMLLFSARIYQQTVKIQMQKILSVLLFPILQPSSDSMTQ